MITIINNITLINSSTLFSPPPPPHWRTVPHSRTRAGPRQADWRTASRLHADHPEPVLYSYPVIFQIKRTSPKKQTIFLCTCVKVLRGAIGELLVRASETRITWLW